MIEAVTQSRTTTVRIMASTEEWSKGGLGDMVPTGEAVVEERLIVKDLILSTVVTGGLVPSEGLMVVWDRPSR
jgi:hypothetical protein